MKTIPGTWSKIGGLEKGLIARTFVGDLGLVPDRDFFISLSSGDVLDLHGYREGASAPNKRWFAANKIDSIRIYQNIKDLDHSKELNISLSHGWSIHQLKWPKENELLALVSNNSTPTEVRLLSIDPLVGTCRSIFETLVSPKRFNEMTTKGYGASSQAPMFIIERTPLGFQLGKDWIYVFVAGKSFIVDKKTKMVRNIDLEKVNYNSRYMVGLDVDLIPLVSPSGRYALVKSDVYQIQPKLKKLAHLNVHSDQTDSTLDNWAHRELPRYYWIAANEFLVLSDYFADPVYSGGRIISGGDTIRINIDQFSAGPDGIKKTGAFQTKIPANAVRGVTGQIRNFLVSPDSQNAIIGYLAPSKEKNMGLLYYYSSKDRQFNKKELKATAPGEGVSDLLNGGFRIIDWVQ